MSRVCLVCVNEVGTTGRVFALYRICQARANEPGTAHDVSCGSSCTSLQVTHLDRATNRLPLGPVTLVGVVCDGGGDCLSSPHNRYQSTEEGAGEVVYTGAGADVYSIPQKTQNESNESNESNDVYSVPQKAPKVPTKAGAVGGAVEPVSHGTSSLGISLGTLSFPPPILVVVVVVMVDRGDGAGACVRVWKHYVRLCTYSVCMHSQPCTRRYTF